MQAMPRTITPEWVAGLRFLADLGEQHPEVELGGAYLAVWRPTNLAAVVAALGPAYEVADSDGAPELVWMVGPHRITVRPREEDTEEMTTTTTVRVLRRESLTTKEGIA